MGIDRALPFGRTEAHKVIILRQPGEQVAMPAAAHLHP
jgi:hypothetical protein